MSNSAHNAAANLHAALEVYRAFLQQRRDSDEVTLDTLCAEHPHLAADLRQLHELAKLAQALAASPSFPHSLREAFGEETGLTVVLDEGDTVFGDAKATVLDTNAKPMAGPAAITTPDRYSLQGEVARGGMGIIYKVRDHELNRTLAMKVLLGAPAASTEKTSHPLRSRFLEEVQVTAQLDHPGIVAVHELGLDAAGRPYFTMKLVKGRDLSRIFELARAGEGWSPPADSERERCG